ncbi:MAG: hypothetical protein U0Q15_11355 [Kineosporiaceae bacterium]
MRSRRRLTVPGRPASAGAALVVLACLALTGCSGEDAQPSRPPTSSAGSTPASSAAASTGAPAQTSDAPATSGAAASPTVSQGPPTGSQSPAPAAAVQACRDAIKKQFEVAQQQQDPGGMPVECKGLSDAQMTQVIGEIMSGKG